MMPAVFAAVFPVVVPVIVIVQDDHLRWTVLSVAGVMVAVPTVAMMPVMFTASQERGPHAEQENQRHRPQPRPPTRSRR